LFNELGRNYLLTHESTLRSSIGWDWQTGWKKCRQKLDLGRLQNPQWQGANPTTFKFTATTPAL
jgi:hypothetical protein